jgi:DNA-binding NarL/FixJ family response regulator
VDGRSGLPDRPAGTVPALRRPPQGPGPYAVRPPTTLVRVALCDDRELYRLGLRVVLESQPDIAVVAEHGRLPDAAAGTGGAQVVVVRQGLVGCAALPLVRSLCTAGAAVLVLAEPCGGASLVEVLRAGVRGFLPHRSPATQLVDAVRALARHEAALDPAATRQLVHHLSSPAPRPATGRRALDRLTERQQDVAQLVAEGLSNEEIAARLFVTLATVKSHLTASMRRLDVRTRTQLAILVNRDAPPAA